MQSSSRWCRLRVADADLGGHGYAFSSLLQQKSNNLPSVNQDTVIACTNHFGTGLVRLPFVMTVICPVQGVRKGNFPVVADNHTLILNWNSYTLPLLRQISVGRQERGDSIYHGCICLLLQTCFSRMS